MTDRNKSYLLSGELARLSGVSSDTIRFYERQGLLLKPERYANGYRKYPADSLQRVRLIRAALAVGFTIDELSRILRIRNQGGKPCHDVVRLALQKLQQIETTIRDLKRMQKDLKTCVREWEQTLHSVSEDRPALLLQKLAEKGSHGGRHSPLIPAGLKKQRRK